MGAITILLNVIYFILNFLPERLCLGIGSVVGKLGYVIDRRHRQLAISNITKVFREDKDPGEVRVIAKYSFQNLGRNIIEFMRDTQGPVRVEGYHYIDSFLKQGKGIIFILGHFGNWEFLGRVAASRGIRLVAVGREIKNTGVNQYIQQRRLGSGLEIVAKKGSIYQLLGALGEGKSVAILIDQYAGRHGIFVDFFGIPTSTSPGPAILALKTSSPVIPVFILREGNKGHRIVIESPITIVKTGDITRDIKTNTQRFVQPLEKYVRMYPDQWWWVHRRWR